MDEIEKVIKCLEMCVSNSFECSLKCPYAAPVSSGFCYDNLMRDALELLKAQQPIEPNDHDPVIYGARYTCGACRHKIYRNENYCHNCGRQVKWNE